MCVLVEFGKANYLEDDMSRRSLLAFSSKLSLSIIHILDRFFWHHNLVGNAINLRPRK